MCLPRVMDSSWAASALNGLKGFSGCRRHPPADDLFQRQRLAVVPHRLLEAAPYLAGCAAPGGSAVSRAVDALDDVLAAFQRVDDLPQGDLPGGAGQDIPAVRAAHRPDQPGAPKRDDQLREILLREVLVRRDLAQKHRPDPILSGQFDQEAEAVPAARRDLHFAPVPDLRRRMISSSVGGIPSRSKGVDWYTE